MSMDLAVKTYRYDPHHFEAGVGPRTPPTRCKCSQLEHPNSGKEYFFGIYVPS